MKTETEAQPHVPRSGVLKNGNSGGNFSTAPRCGAKTRNGHPCAQPAMRNRRRCRFHGGLSTGPRTPEGLERMRMSKLKHGKYSKEAKAVNQYLRNLRATLARLKKKIPR